MTNKVFPIHILIIIIILTSCSPKEVKAKVLFRSMEPTIKLNQIITLNVLDRDVNRWDIVVYKAPYNPSILALGRVVGIPGEKIDINKDGSLTINSKRIIPPNNIKYINAGNLLPYTIPENSYFILGDNSIARDSRYIAGIHLSLIKGFYKEE